MGLCAMKLMDFMHKAKLYKFVELVRSNHPLLGYIYILIWKISISISLQLFFLHVSQAEVLFLTIGRSRVGHFSRQNCFR